MYDEEYQGSIICDEPEKILGASVVEFEDEKQIWLNIKWKKRANGMRPLLSRVNSYEFSLKYPMMLIAFYESKIKN